LIFFLDQELHLKKNSSNIKWILELQKLLSVTTKQHNNNNKYKDLQ
jgi:hypothetical protein